jgi:hypothetical protein
VIPRVATRRSTRSTWSCHRGRRRSCSGGCVSTAPGHARETHVFERLLGAVVCLVVERGRAGDTKGASASPFGGPGSARQPAHSPEVGERGSRRRSLGCYWPFLWRGRLAQCHPRPARRCALPALLLAATSERCCFRRRAAALATCSSGRPTSPGSVRSTGLLQAGNPAAQLPLLPPGRARALARSKT